MITVLVVLQLPTNNDTWLFSMGYLAQITASVMILMSIITAAANAPLATVNLHASRVQLFNLCLICKSLLRSFAPFSDIKGIASVDISAESPADNCREYPSLIYRKAPEKSRGSENCRWLRSSPQRQILVSLAPLTKRNGPQTFISQTRNVYHVFSPGLGAENQVLMHYP